MLKPVSRFVPTVSRRSTLGILTLPLTGGVMLLPQRAVAQGSTAAAEAIALINGPDGLMGTIVKRVGDKINLAVAKKENISILVDRSLTRTHRSAVYMWIFSDQFFHFPLSERYAKLFGTKKNTDTIWTGPRRDITANSMAGKLSSLEIESADRLDGYSEIQGQLECRRLSQEPMDFAIRTTCRLQNATWGVTRTHWTTLPKNAPLPDGLYHFKSGTVNDRYEDKKFLGPTVMFIDFVTVDGREEEQKLTRHTNTVAAIANVVVA